MFFGSREKLLLEQFTHWLNDTHETLRRFNCGPLIFTGYNINQFDIPFIQERLYSRQQKILDLEHYLEVPQRKPGALAGSTPLEQWRRQGRWPARYDRFWAEWQQRRGRHRRGHGK